MKPRSVIAALALSSLAVPLAAETASTSFQTTRSGSVSNNALSQFAPASDRTEHRLDYEHWDEALRWIVIPMGPSLRVAAPRVEAETGTRIIYGHESRYRLEGNRVAFSYLNDDVRASLTEYRQDLERIGSELDLTRLPRNEQLAFWLNLHNVAVIEALAYEYPLAEPHERQFGSNGAPLQDAKLVTVKGVSLSPREIREGIVYPNWQDPKVMYGFWRGVIGGPSIQRIAYTGENVDALLALSAEEFINSLRAVERWGGALRVSPIYEEAAPFYFENSDALRAHLSTYAREDTGELIARSPEVAYKSLETDLADLSRGDRDPALSYRTTLFDPGQFGQLFDPAVTNSREVPTRPNRAIQRLMRERDDKLRKAEAQGIRTGMVIYGDGRYVEGEAPKEVE